jgi:hypothetical protein
VFEFCNLINSDFERQRLIVRHGNGNKPRTVLLTKGTAKSLWGAGIGRSLDRQMAVDLCSNTSPHPGKGNITDVSWGVLNSNDYQTAFNHGGFDVIADLKGDDFNTRQYWVQGTCNHPYLTGITYYSGAGGDASLGCSVPKYQIFQVKCIAGIQ